jgi:hypothetical protein
MSRKALWAAIAVGVLCGVAILTLATWPRYEPGSWGPLSPAWWQLEWLVSVGIVLSAAPSVLIYAFNDFFAANEHLRLPAVIMLMALEVSILCLATYGVVALITRRRSQA